MTEWPFLGSAALRRGDVTRNDLRTRYRAVYRNAYVPTDAVVDATVRARAAWLSTGATLAGMSAAAVWGTKWLDHTAPAEIIRADRHSQRGIVAHTYTLSSSEVDIANGMRLTTPARTAFDIGRGRSTETALPILDALFRATRVKPDDVTALIDMHPGIRGVRQLQVVLDLVDGGAESPQESRVRYMLIVAGLPSPETQIEFFDDYGNPFIRVDMGWRAWKVAIEYDGIQHWTDRRQRSWDIERIAILEAMGWTVIRVSAEMLSRPDVVIGRVRAKLRAAGCPI
jgi:hypothetical protein